MQSPARSLAQQESEMNETLKLALSIHPKIPMALNCEFGLDSSLLEARLLGRTACVNFGDRLRLHKTRQSKQGLGLAFIQ